MESKIKSGLFIFLFIILLLPILQQNFPFITSGPLIGIFPLAENVTFSLQNWGDASYQSEKNKYLNDHFGFRPDMIRFTNQAYYTLLKKINHIRIVEGDDHNLFLNVYIDGYYGKDFIGYTAIHEKVMKLKAIQDTLAHLGKSFIMVHSPSKAYVYPEKFPQNYKIKKTGVNNYDAYIAAMDSARVNMVDINAWFYAIKHKTQEPIWTKLGIHWSIYGSLIAADSVTRYMEQLRHIHMPHPTWTKVVHTDTPRYKENDISAIMNMIFPITTETHSYPEVTYPEDATTTKPKVVYIGDSFFIAWILYGILDHIDSAWEVWYYFNSKMDKDHHDGVSMEGYDWINAINNTDYVVMMYTPDNLEELGNGFIEKAYDHYYPKK